MNLISPGNFVTITDTDQQYSNYNDMAEHLGYPNCVNNKKNLLPPVRKGMCGKVLAVAKHFTSDDILVVIQIGDNQFLFSVLGLKLLSFFSEGDKVVVVNDGVLYTTYTSFAEEMGFPDAATEEEPEDSKINGQTATILAIAGSPSIPMVIIETNERKWIIGADGLMFQDIYEFGNKEVVI